jgi:hypothetical protein
MIIRDLLQCPRAKYFFHLRFKGSGKQSVDVMIAVIHQYETSVRYILVKIPPFIRGELHQLVPAEITKRTTKNVIASERYDILLCINLQSCVFDEAVENVRGHTLIHIPITGLVLQACEKEFVIGDHHWKTLLYR